MTLREKIFIFGASGHAKVIIDIVERQGSFDIACLIDDNPALKDTVVFGYRVLGGSDDITRLKESSGISKCVIAIGNNRVRELIDKRLSSEGIQCICAIHPSAQISRGALIGEGTVVMAGAIVNAEAGIGRNVIINTASVIEHECVIGDYAHIAPGVKLCGNVKVGARSLLGVGSSVIPNLKIGSDVVVGAGSTVLKDVQNGLTVVGSPARVKNHL